MKQVVHSTQHMQLCVNSTLPEHGTVGPLHCCLSIPRCFQFIVRRPNIVQKSCLLSRKYRQIDCVSNTRQSDHDVDSVPVWRGQQAVCHCFDEPLIETGPAVVTPFPPQTVDVRVDTQKW